jgi:hypothetical protein
LKKQIHLSILIVLFWFTMASSALAEKYHGEYCFQVFNIDGQPFWTYNFGVYEKVGGHLTLYGSIDYGANGISAVHGNAIIVGNKIKLTIVSADYEEQEEEVWGETLTASLDVSTLNGEWNALSLITEDSINAFPVFQKGTINRISCS